MRRTLVAIAMLTIAGCGRSDAIVKRDGTITVVDDNGREVTLQRAATRVISTVPAATEIIRALGADSVIIARIQEDTLPKDLPSIGPVLEPSVEKIISFRPDFVIVWAEADLVIGRLAASGVTSYAARFDRISAAASHIRRLGKLIGREGSANALANQIARGLDSHRAHFHAMSRPTVLYLLETEPIWTAGSGTFVDDMIQIAGGENVFGDLRRRWSQVTLEAILARQPEVIVVAQRGPMREANWLKQAGWRDLRAVQNGRIHFIRAELFNTPGPNVLNNVRELSRVIHMGEN